MAPSLKELKEAFVSNHTGGTIAEINLVTTVAPTAVLVWSALQSQYGFFEQRNLASFLADFILNVATILLSTTLYSSSPGMLVILLLVSPFLYRFSPSDAGASKAATRPPPKKSRDTKDNSTNQDLNQFPIRPFITAYRGGMMVITVSSILAVDFPVFPRRFAKVETWGTSLMDVGVGSFVFAAGLVASKAAIKDTMLAKQEGGNKQRKGVFSRALIALRQALPLLVLGFGRLLSVKNLDYAEHVSEYGVHWNFFFTMAIVPFAMAIVQPLISMIPGPSYAMMGLLISTGYQVALESTDLKKWALTADRVDLLSQNKEGVVSSFGYIAIYLLGMSTGTIVLPREFEQSGLVTKLLDILGLKVPTKASVAQSADKIRLRLLARLLLSSLFYWALLGAHMAPGWFPSLSVGVSRRLANLPYVLWIGAFNTMQITLYCLVESYFFPGVRQAKTPLSEKEEAAKATSKVLDDFNAGGLVVFLVANLGTGLVNMTVDTLEAGTYRAMAVLVTYLVVLSFTATYLRGVKLKI